ncbi:MAG: hypothetical protein FWE23_06835 [Chitinivibrionia bacterium]|nr:hypothetical protein [Chitinivibrionia bacterium]
MELKKNELPMNELLGNVVSIVCVLSSSDPLDVVIEDVSALKAMSPSAEIRIISETTLDGFLLAEAKPTEIVKVPPQRERADFSLFLQKIKKMNVDILYCRNAENSPVILSCLSKMNTSIAVFFGNQSQRAVMKCKVLRIEDDEATLKNVMPFISDIIKSKKV